MEYAWENGKMWVGMDDLEWGEGKKVGKDRGSYVSRRKHKCRLEVGAYAWVW